MGSLERTTITLTLLTILLTSYGVSIGGVPAQQALNGIFGPWPSLAGVFPPLKGCNIIDVFCNAGNVAQATAEVALAIEYPAILLFTILNRVAGFLQIVTAVLFGTESSLVVVPFLDIAVLGILILPAAYELFRMARGNASAGTL